MMKNIEKEFINEVISRAIELGLDVFVCTNNEYAIKNNNKSLILNNVKSNYIDIINELENSPTFKDLFDSLLSLKYNDNESYLFNGGYNDQYPKWIVSNKRNDDCLEFIIHRKLDKRSFKIPIIKFEYILDKNDYNLINAITKVKVTSYKNAVVNKYPSSYYNKLSIININKKINSVKWNTFNNKSPEMIRLMLIKLCDNN